MRGGRETAVEENLLFLLPSFSLLFSSQQEGLLQLLESASHIYQIHSSFLSRFDRWVEERGEYYVGITKFLRVRERERDGEEGINGVGEGEEKKAERERQFRGVEGVCV